jgi:hypothetical protein
MNITGLFYLLFFADILIAVIVGVFTDFVFGLITDLCYCLKRITFYFVQKIQK